MMNKKGFTLIELLAVIVILAVIAIIAVPVILGVIEKAKEGSAVDGAYGYIHAVENGVTLKEVNDKILVENGKYENLREFETANKIEVKGTKPTSGFVTLEKRRVKRAELVIDGYLIICENNLCSSLGKVGKLNIDASDIIFNPEDSNWHVGTVKAALDDLTTIFE